MEVIQSLNKNKTDIIEELLLQRKGFLEVLISGNIPFPLNVIVDGTSEIINRHNMKEFSWYFFLLDIKSGK